MMESQLNKDAIIANIGKAIKIYRDDTLCSIDEVNREEQKKKKERIEYIAEKYPSLTKSPIIGKIVKFFFFCGLRNIAAILIILIIFTLIKAPYFSRPFTGEHSLKYNSYVEPAMYMAERNNPFWVQYRYLSDPVRNPEGIQKKYGKMPLLEWGLFLTYKVMPGNNIEVKTRIFTHLIGVLIILFAYMFFQFWLGDALALLIAALIALNPIFSLSTFVTVADSVLFMMMFVSLIYLNKYLEENNYSYLYMASLIYGIGITVKYSVFLWTSPIALALLIDKEKKIIHFILDYLFYIVLAVSVILFFKTSINKLPSNTTVCILFGILWLVVYYVIYIFIVKKGFLLKISTGQIQKKHLLALSLGIGVLFIAMIAMMVSFVDFKILGNKYLADIDMLLKPRIYKYMVLNQFKLYSSTVVFKIGFIGALLLIVSKMGKIHKITIAFGAGTLVYWIFAMKAVFIHSYYTVIMMIFICILASTCIFYIIKILPSVYAKILFAIIFLAVIMPPIYTQSAARLGKSVPIKQISHFIINNTKMDELVLYEGYYSPIAIKTKRGMVRTFRLEDETIVQSIKAIGFAETMRKYKIKFLITPNEKPSYADFAPLFTDDKSMKSTTFDRKYLIYKRVGIGKGMTSERENALKRIIDEYNIKEKFVYVGKIDGFNIYSFKN